MNVQIDWTIAILPNVLTQWEVFAAPAVMALQAEVERVQVIA